MSHQDAEKNKRLHDTIASVKNQCTVILTKEGDRCPLEAGHSEPHELDLTLPPQRKLAIAIASELLALDFIREKDVSGIIFAIEKELERDAAA